MMLDSTRLIRSVFTLGAAQMLSWVGGAALTILMPRYLGDVNLGKLAFGFALTGLVGLLADVGTSVYLTKELARDRSSAKSLMGSAMAMRLPLSVLAMALAVLIVHLPGYDPLTQQIVYVLSCGILVSAVANVAYGVLQGLQQMASLAVYALVTKLGYAGLAGALLLWGFGPLEVAFASLVFALVGLAVVLVAVFRRVELSLPLDLGAWRCVFLGGMPYFLWQAALVVYGQIDMVMLSHLAHDAVVGWYAAAYRIVTIPVFLPTIVMTVIFPALAAAAKDAPVFNTIARRAVHTIALVSVPIAFGIMLLPDKIIGLLGYPEGFTNSIVPIVLLAPHVPLAGVDTVIGTVLNARDRQRQWALTGVAAALLNPLLNLVLIPYSQHLWGNGAIGAAAVTTVTEVFMLVVGLRLLPADVLNRTTVAGILKTALAGLMMAAVVFVVRDQPLVVPVLLGALAYGAGSLALGTISLGDLRLLRLHLLSSRRAPAGVSGSSRTL